MAVESERELKQCLFDAYGGFADKRIRNIDRNEPFIVDDRGPGDLDARKRLFLWFCQLFVTVEAVDRVKLTFRGGVPQSAGVSAWFAKHGGEPDAGGVTVIIRPDTVAALGDLADAFRAILARRYDTPAYKYVVPRVAASLRQLADVLDRAWT